MVRLDPQKFNHRMATLLFMTNILSISINVAAVDPDQMNRVWLNSTAQSPKYISSPKKTKKQKTKKQKQKNNELMLLCCVERF